MADIDVVPSLVRPLNGAIRRRKTAGGSGNVGDAVYYATDGDAEQADADAVGSAQARGIVVAVGTQGKTTFVEGDSIDVVTHGPVELGATGLTDGAAVFVSTTAGKLDQTAPASAGDFPFAIGYAESDTVIYVDPQVTVPVVNE